MMNRIDRHGHTDAQIRDEFAEHEPRAAQRADEQLLEGSAFAFADERHGGGNGRADLQNNADHARNVEVRTAHRRVVKHLRAEFRLAHRAARFRATAIQPIASALYPSRC